MPSSSPDLHIIFLPFPSPGHILPLIDIAKIMSGRSGVRATIITTAGNAPFIQPSIASAPPATTITLLTIPFPSTTCPENTTALPTAELTQEFIDALDSLEPPVEHLIRNHHIAPDCIVADFCFPWATDIASRLRIPRVVFGVIGNFPGVVFGVLSHAKPQDEQQSFELPGLPHPVRLTMSQLPKDFLPGASMPDYWTEFAARMNDSSARSFAVVLNSFYEMEPRYVDMLRNGVAPRKVWNVGPVSLCNDKDWPASENYCLNWLEKQQPGSVLYMCFGSLGQFTGAQLSEMAVGLEACGRPFIWVLRNGGDESEWMPEGFEDRVVVGGKKGIIVRGWVPQVPVLNHPATGGFVTQCGWNSILEGVTAGVPMITWPLIVDQFFTERLIVDVLGIGVAVGSKISSYSKEERTLVSGEQLLTAVNELMGESEEAAERRRRVKELSVMARGAVKEGGSSYNDMMDMIQELVNVKMAKAE